MSYAADHASALAGIRDAGTTVTFTRVSGGYVAATGLGTPTSSTVAGAALRVPGDPQRYARIAPIMLTYVTLLFSATTYGEHPAPGDTVVWGGLVHTVRDVEPLDLDGVGAILASIVVGR